MFFGMSLTRSVGMLFFMITAERISVAPWIEIIWTEGPGGNVEYIAEHGLTTEEVEYVLANPTETDFSRSSSRPIAFGYTPSGTRIAVVFEWIDRITILPITAYAIEE